MDASIFRDIMQVWKKEVKSRGSAWNVLLMADDEGKINWVIVAFIYSFPLISLYVLIIVIQ